MPNYLWRVSFVVALCACTGDISSTEPIEPIDPACAGDEAPSTSPRVEGLDWDLAQDLDADTPVCPADDPDCDLLADSDAIEDDQELAELQTALEHEDDPNVVYALTEALTSTNKYRTWPGGRIPYKYGRDGNGNYLVNATTRTRLSQAMTNWEQLTEGRIKFRPKLASDKAYVVVKNGSPLVRPFVGYRKDQVQELHLRNSEYLTVAKHELGHVIGLHHEQRRSDRSSSIQVRTANIVNSDLCRYQFAVCSTCKKVGTYDRISVMHYRTNELANCRTGPVLLKLDGSAINHVWKLSTKDLNAVATMYASSTNPTPPVVPNLPDSGSLVNGEVCASVPDASTAEAAEVQTATCAGGGNQNWRITSSGQLRVQHSLQCAAVVGCSYDGAVVEQVSCNDAAPDQKFAFTDLEIVNGMTSKCLEASTDGQVIAFAKCSGAATQRFTYRAETETLESSNLCLTGSEDAAIGDNVALAPCDGRTSQQWIQARGSFVTRANTARCMRIESGVAAGTKLELGDCNDTIDQRWALRGSIKDARSQLCLSGGAAGTRLALTACDAMNAAQIWTFWSR